MLFKPAVATLIQGFGDSSDPTFFPEGWLTCTPVSGSRLRIEDCRFRTSKPPRETTDLLAEDPATSFESCAYVVASLGPLAGIPMSRYTKKISLEKRYRNASSPDQLYFSRNELPRLHPPKAIVLLLPVASEQFLNSCLYHPISGIRHLWAYCQVIRVGSF